MERAPGALEALRRLASPEHPIPSCGPLEKLVLPGADHVVAAVRELCAIMSEPVADPRPPRERQRRVGHAWSPGSSPTARPSSRASRSRRSRRARPSSTSRRPPRASSATRPGPARTSPIGGVHRPDRRRPAAPGRRRLGADGRRRPRPTGDARTRRTDRPPLPLAPSVRRLVAEANVDPPLVRGTGRGGRITKGDVLAYLATSPAAEPPPPPRARPGSAARPASWLADSGSTSRPSRAAAWSGLGDLRAGAPTPRQLTPTPARPPPRRATPRRPVAASGVPTRAGAAVAGQADRGEIPPLGVRDRRWPAS